MANLTINSKVRLNSGYDIPLLGFGVWQTPADTCEGVVQHALKSGYRHIDSAAAYRNEAPCGKAILNSGLKREDIFFTSKVPARTFSYENTLAQVEKTLKETGLTYIDLMLLHAPYGGREARKGAWKALVEAHNEGKIRSIGVSNYGVHPGTSERSASINADRLISPDLNEMEEYIQELEKEGKGKGGVISVNQLEIHPWVPRSDIVEWCQKRGIVVEAYSPLVRGQRMEENILQPLTKKYGKTPAQVLLRWSLQKGLVPLPKSVTPSRIEENAKIFDFELTLEEMKTLELNEYSPVCWDPTIAKLEQ